MPEVVQEVRQKRRGHRLRRMLITLVIAYLLWLTFIFFVQDALLFPRWMVNDRYQSAPAGVETWTLDHADGVRTEARFVPAQGDGAHPLVVLLHGNAMLAQDWEPWAEQLASDGWNVLLPEFRGYGTSGGKPTRDALVQDLVEAIERARTDPRVDPVKLAIYGRSIGGAIAAEAATKLKSLPSVLILHTTPARIADFSWRYGAPPFLVRCRLDAENAVEEIVARDDAKRCALCVIGHRQDEIVPRSHPARLAKAAGVPLIEVDGTHNGYGSYEAEATAESAIHAALQKAR